MLALLGVYVTFGLLGPVTAKYMAQILAHAETNVTIIVAAPTPMDGIVNYVSQVGQIGLIVAVVVAAAALAFDARRGISTFLRTRIHGIWSLMLPRYTVAAAFAVLAYTLGTVAAWYETRLLLGPLPAAGMLGGLLCQAVYLAFAVAVVALAASLARGTLGTVGIALGVLLVLPLVGALSPVHDWLPSTLTAAPFELITGRGLSDFGPALAVAAVATPALLAAAVARLRRRKA